MACVPFAKASISNIPTGPFQTMVPALFNFSPRRAAVFGPMSRIISSVSTSSGTFVALRARRGLDRYHYVLRQRNIGGRGDPPGFLDQIGLGQRMPDGLARREQERVGDAAADDQAVDLFRELA